MADLDLVFRDDPEGASTNRSSTGKTLPVVEFSIGSTSRSTAPSANAAKAATKLGYPISSPSGNISRDARSL